MAMQMFSNLGVELKDSVQIYAPITTQKLIQLSFKLKVELVKLFGGVTVTTKKGQGVWTDQNTGETWHDTIEIIEALYNGNPVVDSKLEQLILTWGIQSGEKAILVKVNGIGHLMEMPRIAQPIIQ